MAPSEPIDPLYQCRFDSLVLWRDGNRAVVSICIAGRWVRLMACDCRGNFYEEVSSDGLRQASRADRDKRRTMRRNDQRPLRTLEAAE